MDNPQSPSFKKGGTLACHGAWGEVTSHVRRSHVEQFQRITSVLVGEFCRDLVLQVARVELPEFLEEFLGFFLSQVNAVRVQV